MTTLARFIHPRLLTDRFNVVANRLGILFVSFVVGEVVLVAGAETTLLTAAGLILFSAVDTAAQLLASQTETATSHKESLDLGKQALVCSESAESVAHKFRKPRTAPARQPVSVSKQFPHEKIANTTSSQLQILLCDR